MSSRKYGANWSAVGRVGIFGVAVYSFISLGNWLFTENPEEVLKETRIEKLTKEYKEMRDRIKHIGSSIYIVQSPDLVEYRPKGNNNSSVYTYNFQTKMIFIKPYKQKHITKSFNDYGNDEDIQRILEIGCRYAKNRNINLQNAREIWDAEANQISLERQLTDNRLFMSRHCTP